MAQNSNIEWTDHTFNPWIGCTKVSPGCANCYADAQDKFRKWTPNGWGKNKLRKRTSESNWREPLKWNKAEADKLVSHAEFIANRRPRVFCASLADWLDDEVPVEWLADLLKLIHDTPNLDWLLLTKRPENFNSRLINVVKGFSYVDPMDIADKISAWVSGERLFANVWLGVTVENQEMSDKRRDVFKSIPARIKFVSYEPALSNVEWTGWEFIDWLIAGGESGASARPMHPDWVRSARDWAVNNGKKFLFKQWGEWTQRCLLEIDGKPYGGSADFAALDPGCERWPQVIRMGKHGKDTRRLENRTEDMGHELFVQRVGKKAAGRLLDGREWNEFPMP